MDPTNSVSRAAAQPPDGELSGEDVARAFENAFVHISRWMTQPDVRVWIAGASPVLSLPESTLLTRIVQEGPVRMSTLAEWQGLDRSTVTTQVAGLEARDLVIREPDPSDGRAVLVNASATAREALDRAGSRSRDLLNSFVRSWPEVDRQTLAALLDRLVASMEEKGGAALEQ